MAIKFNKKNVQYRVPFRIVFQTSEDVSTIIIYSYFKTYVFRFARISHKCINSKTIKTIIYYKQMIMMMMGITKTQIILGVFLDIIHKVYIYIYVI